MKLGKLERFTEFDEHAVAYYTVEINEPDILKLGSKIDGADFDGTGFYFMLGYDKSADEYYTIVEDEDELYYQDKNGDVNFITNVNIGPSVFGDAVLDFQKNVSGKLKKASGF